jgi:hypothetical protein
VAKRRNAEKKRSSLSRSGNSRPLDDTNAPEQVPVSLEPLTPPTVPSYPARRAPRRRILGFVRRVGAAIAATAALVSTPARADDDWMFWLEDMEFCPEMDCAPRTYRTAGVPHVVAYVRGSLSADIIRRHVRLQSSRVRACYERRLQLHPGLAGRVEVRFVIRHDGSVTAAEIVTSTLADGQVETCVREVVASITFPIGEDDGVYVVTYPFLFHPRQARALPP